MELVRAFEDPAVTVEASLDRGVEDSRQPRRHPKDPPRPGGRVEQAQGRSLDGLVAGTHDGGLKVAEPAQNRGAVAARLELDPLRAVAVGDVGEFADRAMPPAEEEVEVVPA